MNQSRTRLRSGNASPPFERRNARSIAARG
jgi:hypothetical protein